MTRFAWMKNWLAGPAPGVASTSSKQLDDAAIAAVWTRILAARAHCAEHGSFSWTSLRYQNDVLRFILSNAAQGGCVVEVGCYNGGLSLQLAIVTDALGIPFYTMDIDEGAVSRTRELLDKAGMSARATVFLGGLQAFARDVVLPTRPLLIVVDGDHSYAGASRDILAFAALNQRPFAAVFHDYCLRSPHTDERVSDAVAEHLPGLPRIPMGSSPDEDSSMPTATRPAEDGHFWLSPGTEGCLVLLDRYAR